METFEQGADGEVDPAIEQDTRWEHEHLLDIVQQRLDANPRAMRERRETVEHPFGTMKARMSGGLSAMTSSVLLSAVRRIVRSAVESSQSRQGSDGS